jgi:hypothetical protein
MTDGPAPIHADPPTWERASAQAVLVAAMVAFTVTLTRLSRDKALGLMPEWPLDLTFFHNLVWNTVAGHGYRQSATYHEPPGIFNETHFEPILLLATPLYAAWPGLTTLFAFQAALVALGAVGVYRLARSGGAQPLFAAGAGLVYLTWWPVWRMAMADIRPLTWSIPFLLLCAAALREGRRTETLLWGLIACFSREEVPLIVAGLGATALLWRGGDRAATRQRAALGVRLGTAAVVFLVVSTLMRSNASFYIRPDEWIAGLLSGDDSDQTAMWGREAGDLLEVRLRFLGEWLVPAGAACLLAPELLLGAVPLFVYLFSEAHEWAGWEGPYIHHTAPAVALVAGAAALGLPRAVGALLPPGRPRAVVGALLLLGFLAGHRTLLAGYHERVVLAEIEPWRDQHDDVQEAWRLAGLVPPEAVVMADYGTVHLFSGRRYVYCYEQEEFEPVWPAEPGSPLLPKAEVQPDWALVRLDHDAWRARTAGAGLKERALGDRWVLFGPAP